VPGGIERLMLGIHSHDTMPLKLVQNLLQYHLHAGCQWTLVASLPRGLNGSVEIVDCRKKVECQRRLREPTFLKQVALLTFLVIFKFGPDAFGQIPEFIPLTGKLFKARGLFGAGCIWCFVIGWIAHVRPPVLVDESVER
jgi:hypothetical protein